MSKEHFWQSLYPLHACIQRIYTLYIYIYRYVNLYRDVHAVLNLHLHQMCHIAAFIWTFLTGRGYRRKNVASKKGPSQNFTYFINKAYLTHSRFLPIWSMNGTCISWSHIKNPEKFHELSFIHLYIPTCRDTYDLSQVITYSACISCMEKALEWQRALELWPTFIHLWMKGKKTYFPAIKWLQTWAKAEGFWDFCFLFFCFGFGRKWGLSEKHGNNW